MRRPRFANIQGLWILPFVFLAAIPGMLSRPLPDAWGQEAQETKQQKEEREKAAELAAVLSDKKLLAIHREFLSRAEKLALEYENDKDWDKAKTVWGEVLKMAPQHPQAQAKMKLLLDREANAEVVEMAVKATEGWQDTGVVVLAGKPVRIRSKGYWTFGLKMRLTGEGIRIPKELREYNLGCLIGVIDSGDPMKVEPFVVGNDVSLTPDRSGRLLLRMYDISPEDNEGALQVEIRGSFENRNR
jgi:hypothetical protein